MKNEDYLVDGNVNEPATIEDLKSVISLLNTYKIPYLLIGGYALMLQGNQRVTNDIDILIPLGLDVGKKVKEAFKNLPQGVSERIKDEWFNEDDTIRVADRFTIDLLFKCANGEYNYEKLLPFQEIKVLDGIKVSTINSEGLWYTKQTGRSKDIPDLIFLKTLLKSQGIDLEEKQEDFNFEKLKNIVLNKIKKFKK